MMLPSLTIVVPTFNEVDNLPILVPALAKLEDQFAQLVILIVDDNSQDGTAEILASLQESYPCLQYIIRTENPDLSLSVLTGLQAAKTETLLVMDADLSHSPKSIIELAKTLNSESTDFVLGSRFVANASIAENWSWFRHLNAKVAKSLAQFLVPVTDPMSGFFCLRKATFDNADTLNPIGYKIGLELMLKCRCQHIKEVAIHFKDRELGYSKLSLKQYIRYLRHLGRLYRYKWSNT